MDWTQIQLAASNIHHLQSAGYRSVQRKYLEQKIILELVTCDHVLTVQLDRDCPSGTTVQDVRKNKVQFIRLDLGWYRWTLADHVIVGVDSSLKSVVKLELNN